MRFEEKIVELRKAKGLSQEELAEQLGVSRQAVSRWELGNTLPDITNLVQLCELFGVSADYLVKEEVNLTCTESGTEKESETDSEKSKKKARTLARIAKERAKKQQMARTCYYAGWVMAVACISFSIASLINSDRVESTICIVQCICTLLYFGLYAWSVKKIEKLDMEKEHEEDSEF